LYTGKGEENEEEEFSPNGDGRIKERHPFVSAIHRCDWV
jgi:hypothetical protein